MRRLVILGAFLLLSSAAFAGPADRWSGEWPSTDFSQRSVDLGEIMSGGPPKDGIPAIDDPAFLPVADAADELVHDEPVISLSIDGDARAYPLRILMWHEIVNDVVGGVPVAVTFCPLCNSAVVFERTIDGEVTTFGTTGKLRHSDLVMYDRATESWWQQFEGRSIVGERVGMELVQVPSRLESLAAFRDRHPEGRVQIPADPGARDYGRNPYVGYDSAQRPFLYRGDYDGPGSPLMRVVKVADRAEAWSLDLVRKSTPIEAGELVITWNTGKRSALDAAFIARSRDVGNVTVQRRTEEGSLEDVVYDLPFAFAFRAFNPEAPIHHLDDS